MSESELPKAKGVDLGMVSEVRKHNQRFLEAKYLGDVSQFRAEVIERMLGADAIHGVFGWLYYQESSQTESNVLVDDRGKETLIVLFRSRTNPKKSPHIKVVTNTEFRLDSATAYLTEEITVDDDADSQLLVDAVCIGDDGTVLASKVPGVPTTSPLFTLRTVSNELIPINFHRYTPIMPLSALIDVHDDPSSEIFPFGHYSNLEDKIAALEWAKDIVDATDHAELIAVNTGQQL